MKHRIDFFHKLTPKIFHQNITKYIYQSYIPYVNIFNDNQLKNAQFGGGIEKQFKYEFDGYLFNINIEKTKYDMLIRILTHKEINPLFCANIIVDRYKRLAIINNISYHKDCIKSIQPGLPENTTGSIILKFILKFLKANNEQLNINRIVLTDNSFKICPKCPNNIKLSHLNTLLYGDTWYGKYGFRPYDNINEIPNKYAMKQYEKNKQIALTTITKNTILLDHIKKIIYKHKLFDIDRNAITKQVNQL